MLDDCALAALSRAEQQEAVSRSVFLLAFAELLVDALARLDPLALVVVVRFYFKTAHTTHVGILDQIDDRVKPISVTVLKAFSLL